MSDPPPLPLILIKWGGSLITDKARPETARPEVIARLAAELRELTAARPERVILGHGSGSFGHAAAHRHGVADGVTDPAALPGVSRTQDQAARLHRLVVSALIEVGLAPFSVVPGSLVVTDRGRAPETSWGAARRALELGMLPVVHGDVVLDRGRGTAILSTERVLVSLASDLLRRGASPAKAFWLGETAGVWGPDGATLPRLDPAEIKALVDVVGGSAATDVTGGMRHRLDGALELLDLGIESWILDGREERVVERVLSGEALGTRIGSTAS